MINFLPEIYKNELFYSIIARYQRMCGMVSKRALMRDIFGEVNTITSSYFPQYIDRFVNNLPPTSKITVQEIINNHTMFPFYTAFLPKAKTEMIYKIMEKGGNKSRINIEQLIGFGGSKVKRSNYLKYCPICFKEDIDTLGESYWRTNHQIVGSLYCLKHHVLLKDSSVLSTGSGIQYWCADQQTCDAKVLMDPYPIKIKELNIEYVKNAELLLHNGYPRKELDYIIRFYIDRLREKGLASSNGSLYMKEVLSQFMLYYPEQYLELMQSSFTPDSPSNWLRLFVTGSNKNRIPLRHLLYIQFLGVDLDTFFRSDVVVGKKPDTKSFNPIFDKKKRREKWMKLVTENHGATRSELKEIGKGLHTWIFRHDREWYEKVTPRNKARKRSADSIDWEQRDTDCLRIAKQAVETILNRDGKPTRITPTNIRNTLGIGIWFNNKKLIKTNQFLQEVKENTEHFRIRKIKWAIDEMLSNEDTITPYKIQLFAGFGGSNKEIRELILQTLEEYK